MFEIIGYIHFKRMLLSMIINPNAHEMMDLIHEVYLFGFAFAFAFVSQIVICI